MSSPAPTAAPHEEFFLGRQPILDRQRRIVAYELLFRASRAGYAQVSDDLEASATVITRAFSDFGLESVLGRKRGFINVSHELLMSDMIEALPSRQIVLELLETVPPTEEVADRCLQLKAQGFTLALDDFLTDHEGYARLLEVVDIVKVDVAAVKPEELAATVAGLRRWASTLLAEKLDDEDTVRRCMDLGFELFQGYFFARPDLLSGKRSDPNRVALLRLVGLVMGDTPDQEIETEFKHQPDLSYRLLRLVNSVAMGLTRTVSSVRQAVTLLGRTQLKRWIMLLSFTATDSGGEHPSPLLHLAASRSRMMELLARKAQPGNRELPERAFLAGMLSLAEPAFGVPIAEVLEQLRPGEDIAAALSARQGLLGCLLNAAEGVELGDFAMTEKALGCLPGLTPGDLSAAEVEALTWANSLGESN